MDISTINQVAIMISDLGRGPLYVAMVALSYVLGFGLNSWRDKISRGAARGDTLASDLLRLSWRLSVFWVIGVLLNLGLKHLICAPRPWWIDTSLLPINPHPARGFGMPSGHTQSAIGVTLACLGASTMLKRHMMLRRHMSAQGWGWRLIQVTSCVIGVGWALSIAWSRVYLNAHSVAQVVAGASLGVVWAWSLSYIERHDRGVLISLIFTIICSGLSISASLSPLELPEAWRAVILERGVNPPSAPELSKVLSLSALGVILCVMSPTRRSKKPRER